MAKVVVALVLLWPLAGLADLRAGEDAFKRGNYAGALRLWRPLAEAGDAGAQVRLGIIYAEGYGVVRDEAEAEMWFRRAAEQGHVKAQLNLGMLYMYSLIGGAAQPDNVRAYAWLDLAAQQDDEGAAYLRDQLRRRRDMTAERIAEAEKLSRALCAKIPGCAR